jgi:hypothetical protein
MMRNLKRRGLLTGSIRVGLSQAETLRERKSLDWKVRTATNNLIELVQKLQSV